jgi:hypothetical protein
MNVGPWQLFQFRNPTHSWGDSLEGGSARRKTATYTGQHEHRINAQRYSCLVRDCNPRPPAFHSAATMIGSLWRHQLPKQCHAYRTASRVICDVITGVLGKCNEEKAVLDVYTALFKPGVRETIWHQSKRNTGTAWTFNQLWSSQSTKIRHLTEENKLNHQNLINNW